MNPKTRKDSVLCICTKNIKRYNIYKTWFRSDAEQGSARFESPAGVGVRVSLG